MNNASNYQYSQDVNVKNNGNTQMRTPLQPKSVNKINNSNFEKNEKNLKTPNNKLQKKDSKKIDILNSEISNNNFGIDFNNNTIKQDFQEHSTVVNKIKFSIDKLEPLIEFINDPKQCSEDFEDTLYNVNKNCLQNCHDKYTHSNKVKLNFNETPCKMPSTADKTICNDSDEKMLKDAINFFENEKFLYITPLELELNDKFQDCINEPLEFDNYEY